MTNIITSVVDLVESREENLESVVKTLYHIFNEDPPHPDKVIVNFLDNIKRSGYRLSGSITILSAPAVAGLGEAKHTYSFYGDN